MNKLLTMTLIGAVGLAGPAVALGVDADVDAKVSTDAAIAKQQRNLEVNRAEKASAKARGNVLDQASQSVQIGANKTAIQTRKLERNLEDKIDGKTRTRTSANVRAEGEMSPSAGSSPSANTTNDIKTDTVNDTRN